LGDASNWLNRSFPDPMPNSTNKAETSLRQLGQQLREGFAKTHPTPEKSLDTVRGAIREQWEKERAERESLSAPENEADLEPPEQEHER
jgi:hypothetical protein